MITNDDNKNWHYLAVKSISKLLRGITSNHDGDFYYLNCLHSYRTKKKLKKHENVCKDHDYSYVKMKKWRTNEEKESYEKQKVCYICEKEFSTNTKYCKVRDPCYYTGKFRGAAHSICNLRYKISREIPIVFHIL